MAANTTPIFTTTPNIGLGVIIATANTAMDGTGTVGTLFTAGANGGRIDYILVKYTGTAIASLIRIFINNGSATTTATNNSLFTEQGTLAYTLSQTAAQANQYIIPLNLTLPAGYKITATVATTVAAGFAFSAYGGDY